jgi:hypothetical protein
MLPVMVNVAITLRVQSVEPEAIGIGATIGALAGFLALFALMHGRRKLWLDAAPDSA